MSEKIVQLNEEVIKSEIRELVRGSVEEILNGLLEAEAQKLTQAALAARLAQIEAGLVAKSDTAEQLDRLKEAILGCYTKVLDIHELTPLILNKLIERIEVGSLEAVNGHKQQEITIVWRFAGRA